MPELPEVEIARRQLHRRFTGQVVTADVLDAGAVRSKLSTKPSDADPDGAEKLRRALGTAEEPVRHGKRIAWPFADHAVLVHLGMTGQFTRADEQPAFARLGFADPSCADLWFVDRRRFGCVTVVPRGSMDEVLREGHGPDALLEPLDGAALAKTLTGKRPIKVALLDQSKLAGLGNIHAAEALWRAGIDPQRACNEVRRWDELAAAIVIQLEQSIVDEDAGTLVYVTDGGPNRFGVYGREAEPCSICATPIAASTQAGRTTYWCPGCQPA